MLDVDHVENPRDFLSQRSKVKSQKPESEMGELFKENGIVLVAITASGKGLRVIGARAQGESIEAAQMRMAEALGIEEYDAVTKDLARASYVVPRDYILWMDEEAIFAPLAQDPSGNFAQEVPSETLATLAPRPSLTAPSCTDCRPAALKHSGLTALPIRNSVSSGGPEDGGTVPKNNSSAIASTSSIEGLMEERDVILVEPNGAIMKAGGWTCFGAKYGLEELGPNSHLFCVPRDPRCMQESPKAVRRIYGYFCGKAGAEKLLPGRIFRVKIASKEELKTLNQANVICRNYPMSADALKKKLRVRDGGEKYVIATQIGSKPVLFLGVRQFLHN
jgi:hypothetical protein